MATSNEPLDEIQWRHPNYAQTLGGLHSNNILFYFAESPFFDRTSNNAVLFTQATFNENMKFIISTREQFEGRLKQMSGLEYIVAQEPAESGPGMGTGVWVIHKQTRRKRDPEDEVTVHAAYYVIGENVYMAPTLADILSFRMVTISSALSKCFAAADNARTWSPALGHMYKTAPSTTNNRAQALESKGATPMPEGQGNKAAPESKKTTQSVAVDSRLAEHSFLIHMQYGGDYMDENPITGKPGDFHLTSTGRKEKLQTLALPNLDTSFKSSALTQPDKKDTKGDKTPKTPTGMPSKSRRKKSKAGATPTSA
ncbi:MED6-domain-containing protein [Daldinia vernicosa]|uniref:MED6-domain-containing protein n=1 Tax=Daldinia vernicosa TaxID=114800 RepID=UPI00200777B2|nr:MED6-domain-containing protein [Daldinia vernicosa]KAI0852375.1 MED6-domain-containing protein [Daldinia vernicosa]